MINATPSSATRARTPAATIANGTYGSLSPVTDAVTAAGAHGLTEAQLDALAAALDEIQREVRAQLGEADARYIHSVLRTQRLAELMGRSLLFIGWLPPAWFAGVALLALSKVLENMEIGHNVLHGQYDWMNDPALHGHRYEWDWACPAASWRHSHNYVHHTYTNIVGQDRDVGYALLRMADGQPWRPINLPQPLYAFLQMLLFEWAVAVHDLEGDRIVRGDKPLNQVITELRPLVRKAARQLAKDYVLFPALAGPVAPLVAAGNLTANVLRNIWAFVVIYCGHFPEGVKMYEPEEARSRGAWYERQICGSANIDGPRWLHILTGHLSHQIEHHLFPDLPARRYPEIAPAVRRICQQYGLPYNSGSLSRQFAGAVRRIVHYATP